MSGGQQGIALLVILQAASRRLAMEADVDLMWLAVNTDNLTGELGWRG